MQINHGMGEYHPQRGTFAHVLKVSSTGKLLPRALSSRLEPALETFPVVAVMGARQTGKNTLVRDLHPSEGRLYLTLDDIDIRDQAGTAPDELVRRARRMTVDEVQREPDLLLAIKRAVDENREPGRFILTGSANLLLMRQISDSLAGRAAYLRLWPLTRREQLGFAAAGIWTGFFEQRPTDWPELVAAEPPPGAEDWHELALRGGYPVPAYQMTDPEARRLWFDGYVQTYLERDLRQLSAIEHLADYRRLMRAASLRTGNLLNQAELARDVGLPASTAQRYLNLMETSFQLVRLEPYSVNRTKRLVKSPKLYWSDTALSLWLAGEARPTGPHLENVVLDDLLAWRDTSADRPEVLYWRTSKGAEVDFVIERSGQVLPVEVKSGSKVTFDDTKNLRVFLREYSDLAAAGLILYTGQEIFWIAERILAAPWWRIV